MAPFPQTLVVQAGCRIDWCGGGFDLWPIGHLYPGCSTLNMNIGLPAKVTLEPHPQAKWVILKPGGKAEVWDPNTQEFQDAYPLLYEIARSVLENAPVPQWKITTACISPPGSGLGGSSALGIALTHALTLWSQHHGIPHTPIHGETALVNFVQNIEATLLRQPAGCQDHWAAVRGGINLITYPPNGPQVTTKPLSSALLTELRKVLLLHSGKQRLSGVNNWSIYKRTMDKDPQVCKALTELAGLGKKFQQLFHQEKWAEILALSKQEWDIRKGLSEELETTETQDIHRLCQNLDPSAWTRVCGAGGGGAVLVIAQEDKHPEILKAAKLKGYQALPYSLEGQPLYDLKLRDSSVPPVAHPALHL
ncbi:MAG: hypothetical protein OXT67_10370 [Zetaproteobacteria bacterium]|nr:hypothetical protein [Zetaproteobacteria bacterium]